MKISRMCEGTMIISRMWRTPRLINRSLVFLVVVAVSCRTTSSPNAVALAPHDAFWNRIQSLCGKAFAGRLAVGAPSDSVMRRSNLVMHVRSCTANEIRIPFHVGTDRSRTWVLTKTSTGLRLKHDHRHEDGKPDSVTQYGGDTKLAGSESLQEFYADALTASLIPAARTNVWTMEVLPGDRFAYGLRREGTDRRIRVEFDLRRTVATPPRPW